MRRIPGFHDDPVKKALVAQLGQMRINSAKVLHRPVMGPLHDLRIAALRAGFALKFFRKFINADHCSLLRSELGHARRIMGEARDLDILFSRLGKDFQSLDAFSFEKRRIMGILQSRKAKARCNLTGMLRSPGYKKILFDLKQVTPHRNIKRFKPESLLNKAFLEVDWKENVSKPREFHKVRMAFKNLRYACEFLTDFYDEKKMQKLIRNIVDVQNVLGEYQDAENAIKTLTQFKIIEKSAVIDRLAEIEKGHARNALKKFRRMWRNKCRRISGAFP